MGALVLSSTTISGATLLELAASGIAPLVLQHALGQGIWIYEEGHVRPDLERARADLLNLLIRTPVLNDDWVYAATRAWAEISGKPPGQARFYREPGFIRAVQLQRDIEIRRERRGSGDWIVMTDGAGWLYEEAITRPKQISGNRRKPVLWPGPHDERGR